VAECRGFSSGKALNCKLNALVLKVGQETYRLYSSLVDYCRHGPTAAKVENIEINYEKYKGEFSGFESV
jgi:acylphosphatase